MGTPAGPPNWLSSLSNIRTPEAVLWVASLACLWLSRDDGASLANGWLVLAGLLFFLGCAARSAGPLFSSVSYADDESPPLWQRVKSLFGQVRDALPLLLFLLLAGCCGYLLWSGGRLPWA